MLLRFIKYSKIYKQLKDYQQVSAQSALMSPIEPAVIQSSKRTTKNIMTKTCNPGTQETGVLEYFDSCDSSCHAPF
jgi:hypothetical protein